MLRRFSAQTLGFLLGGAAAVGIVLASYHVARPMLAYAATFTRVVDYGFDADDDGNEILTATCAAAGTQLTDADSNAQNPAARRYYVTCQTEDCFLCDAAACASPDGVAILAGTAVFLRPDASGAYACRSAGSAGVIRMHPTQ